MLQRLQTLCQERERLSKDGAHSISAFAIKRERKKNVPFEARDIRCLNFGNSSQHRSFSTLEKKAALTFQELLLVHAVKKRLLCPYQRLAEDALRFSPIAIFQRWLALDFCTEQNEKNTRTQYRTSEPPFVVCPFVTLLALEVGLVVEDKLSCRKPFVAEPLLNKEKDLLLDSATRKSQPPSLCCSNQFFEDASN
jgi:hypothetical protein